VSDLQPVYEPPTVEDVPCDGDALATASMITGGPE
jgi:hypothetical protein